jgi:hypothetical protein
MWETVSDMWLECHDTINDALRYGYATSAIELQAQKVNELADLQARVARAWTEARADQNEEVANFSYACIYWLLAVAHMLKMWIAIKEDRTDAAWTHLIDAQNGLSVGLKVVGNDGVEEILKRLHGIEELVFPRQAFVSAGLVFESSNCSICGKVYGDCGHVAGRMYMGETCKQIPVKPSFDHVAHVTSPRDKGCRVINYQKDNIVRCKLTGREIESPPPPEGTWSCQNILYRHQAGEARIERLDLTKYPSKKPDWADSPLQTGEQDPAVVELPIPDRDLIGEPSKPDGGG